MEDYPIFFATMQEPSKDNSGDKIFVRNEDGSPVLDSHGHLIVKHDLFNHDGKTQDGIAEAFLEFAKKEKLSFVGKSWAPLMPRNISGCWGGWRFKLLNFPN